MRTCKTCGAGRVFFVLTWYQFRKTDDFLCTERDCLTDPEKTCGRWRKKVSVSGLSAGRIAQAEEDAQTIAAIVKRMAAEKERS